MQLKNAEMQIVDCVMIIKIAFIAASFILRIRKVLCM